MFDPGSTVTTFALSTALSLYGADHTFDTPVYRQGSNVKVWWVCPQ